MLMALFFFASWSVQGQQPSPGEPPAKTSTPAESTTLPAATPKPTAGVEAWFAQVDGPQQEAYQKQVTKPFETGLADLRVRYLAALEAILTKASAGNQLDLAVACRNEKQAFTQAQNVAADDTGALPAIQALRASFRQELAHLEQTRIARARALLADYDSVLDKNQTLLTQRQRLDEALLLKTKREEIAAAWLTPSPLIAAAGVTVLDSAKAATP